jgi:hypothetical protein
MGKKRCSDILPHFRVTSCLGARDILPSHVRNILPSQTRDILLLACIAAWLLPGPRKA